MEIGLRGAAFLLLVEKPVALASGDFRSATSNRRDSFPAPGLHSRRSPPLFGSGSGFASHGAKNRTGTALRGGVKMFLITPHRDLESGIVSNGKSAMRAPSSKVQGIERVF